VINDVETPEGGWPGAGRPAKNLNYATDNHPMGRDPIGSKDLGRTLSRTKTMRPENKSGSSLSLENKELGNLLNSMAGIKIKTKKIIAESLKPAVKVENEPNMLDENNLLDEL